jgi:hypothetical protein
VKGSEIMDLAENLIEERISGCGDCRNELHWSKEIGPCPHHAGFEEGVRLFAAKIIVEQSLPREPR